MHASTRLALIAAATAIAITTAMDATGYSMFSALPLIVLMAFFWWRGRLSRSEVGFTLGKGENQLHVPCAVTQEVDGTPAADGTRSVPATIIIHSSWTFSSLRSTSAMTVCPFFGIKPSSTAAIVRCFASSIANKMIADSP